MHAKNYIKMSVSNLLIEILREECFPEEGSAAHIEMRARLYRLEELEKQLEKEKYAFKFKEPQR